MPSVFNSLGSNYSTRQVLRILFSRGKERDRKQLQTKLSKQFGGKAYLFYKGREALRQALWASGLKEDEQVAITGFTCYAVDEAVTKAGFTPVYLDVDTDTLQFSAQTLESSLKDNPKIKAVIVQNTLGYPCDIAGIQAVCKKNKLVLIEDLAHSFGLVYDDGREAGTVGDFVMLSFGRDKVVDAVSGGALIAHKNPPEKWHNKLETSYHAPNKKQQRVDRLYPSATWDVRHYYNFGIGKALQVIYKKLGLLPRATDGSFDGFTALPVRYCKEILQLLGEYDQLQAHRKQIADIYREVLPPSVIPKIAQNPKGANELRFPIKINDRKALLYKLKQSDIHIADVWYDSPIAPSRFMTKTNYDGQCPRSEQLTSELLNLPTHRNISHENARKLAERIVEHVKQN